MQRVTQLIKLVAFGLLAYVAASLILGALKALAMIFVSL